MYRLETSQPDSPYGQHVINDLYTAYLFSFMMTHIAVEMARGYKLFSNRWRIILDALVGHETKDAGSPKTPVPADPLFSVTMVSEISDASVNQLIDSYFFFHKQ
jgi:hypothetical protein